MNERPRYIALLRGINVGGYRKIKMADLRQMFHAIGFTNVETYIQSGNVVFNAENRPRQKLSAQITQQISTTFGHEVAVLIFAGEELQHIIDDIPFEEKEGWNRYITFLAQQPAAARLQQLVTQSSTIEIFRAGNRAVYVHINKKTSEKLKFSNAYMEKTLKVSATNRNIRTAKKILSLAAT